LVFSRYILSQDSASASKNSAEPNQSLQQKTGSGTETSASLDALHQRAASRLAALEALNQKAAESVAVEEAKLAALTQADYVWVLYGVLTAISKNEAPTLENGKFVLAGVPLNKGSYERLSQIYSDGLGISGIRTRAPLVYQATAPLAARVTPAFHVANGNEFFMGTNPYASYSQLKGLYTKAIETKTMINPALPELAGDFVLSGKVEGGKLEFGIFTNQAVRAWGGFVTEDKKLNTSLVIVKVTPRYSVDSGISWSVEYLDLKSPVNKDAQYLLDYAHPLPQS
jgi:hypothetical protein